MRVSAWTCLFVFLGGFVVCFGCVCCVFVCLRALGAHVQTRELLCLCARTCLFFLFDGVVLCLAPRTMYRDQAVSSYYTHTHVLILHTHTCPHPTHTHTCRERLMAWFSILLQAPRACANFFLKEITIKKCILLQTPAPIKKIKKISCSRRRAPALIHSSMRARMQ